MEKRASWILKRAAALLMALAMLFSGLPAAVAASADWRDLQITISWVDENGESHSVNAAAITETASGEGCFWVMLPGNAPLYALSLTAAHPTHSYDVYPGQGSVLEGVTDAGTTLDGVNYIPVAFLGSQVVAGTNYAVLCQAAVVYPGAEPYYVIIYIYRDLEGNASILNIADFDIGALCTYGAEE